MFSAVHNREFCLIKGSQISWTGGEVQNVSLYPLIFQYFDIWPFSTKMTSDFRKRALLCTAQVSKLQNKSNVIHPWYPILPKCLLPQVRYYDDLRGFSGIVQEWWKIESNGYLHCFFRARFHVKGHKNIIWTPKWRTVNFHTRFSQNCVFADSYLTTFTRSR